VDETLEATLNVRFVLFPLETSGTAEILLKNPAGYTVTSQSSVKLGGNIAGAEFYFKKGDVDLWYPVGYGEQPLYDLEVIVFNDVRLLQVTDSDESSH